MSVEVPYQSEDFIILLQGLLFNIITIYIDNIILVNNPWIIAP